MTRWVRSGSSQKHKKMPGNATKWGEFDNQHARKISAKKGKRMKHQTDFKQKTEVSRNNSSASTAVKSLNDFFDEDLSENSYKLSAFESGIANATKLTSPSISIKHEIKKLSEDKTDHTKIKLKKRKSFDIKDSFLDEKTNELDSDEVFNRSERNTLQKKSVIQNDKMSKPGGNHKDFTKNSKCPKESVSQQFVKNRKVKKKKKYNKQHENSFKEDETMETLSNQPSFNKHNESDTAEEGVEFVNSSSDKTSKSDKSFQNSDKCSKRPKMEKSGKTNCNSNQSSMTVNSKTGESSSYKVFKTRKEIYLEKLQQKREKLGLISLPRNVETKLHKIKKRLLEKGLPPELQREIMRKARRNEELKNRKSCFGCRKAGHILADCPRKSESLKQETGICFKCGSVEHSSTRCPENIRGFPYASCFICKEQGHISRECPKNKRGIYPKGGNCKLCGNVNHLMKDCPTLKKRATENEEENITLHTISEDASVDAEVLNKEKIERIPKKKSKVVKF